MEWHYKQPVDIIFGKGTFKELKNLLRKFKNPLLVADPFFVKSKYSESIRELDINNIFYNFSSNPDVLQVNECSGIIRKNKTDVIIAVGGGSAIDLAKAASLGLEDITDYHKGNAHIPIEHIPVIAVPTTSGTGSEVTCVSVLTDRRTGKKSPIVSDSFYPQNAVIDPELTYTLPPYITAYTGIDVLCHAVEGYWSKNHQPICDALALHAIRLVFDYLPLAYKEPLNEQAREKLSEASVTAGLAFSLPKTTAPHACSFPLTSIYNIPHGEACGLTLDSFIIYNSEEKRVQELARSLGYKDPSEFADRVYKLKKELGLKLNFNDPNIDDFGLQELVKQSKSPNLYNNPKEVTDKALYELYKNLKGENQNAKTQQRKSIGI